MNRSLSSLLIAFSVHVATGGNAHAQDTLYVNGSSTSGAGDGSSWVNAFRGPDALSVALNTAAYGDEVWVAEGLYFPSSAGDRSASFPVRAGVHVYGGFQGSESSPQDRPPAWSHPSVLSGDYAQDDEVGGASMSDNCRQVIRSSGATWDVIFDGFIVEGGNADGTDGASTRFGGGFFHDSIGGSPRFSHMWFRRNRASHSGGAVGAQGGPLVMEDCRFDENYATLSGGAINAWYDHTEVRRCTFQANVAQNWDGGALYLRSGFATSVEDCLFRRNVAGREGAALHFGIGLLGQESHVRGCTFVDNACPNRAIGCATSSGVLTSARYSISNCIAWNNRGSAGIDVPSSQFALATSIEHSIAGGGHAGVGVFDVDPHFVDPSNGDYRLAFHSPAIDAGTNMSPTASSVDLAGSPRYFDVSSAPDTGVGTAPIVDMGAFESRDRISELACLGDSGCPCGNDGGTTTGCVNSRGQGGILRASGSSRLALNDLVLAGDALPLGTIALLFAGSTQLPAAATIGDGLRCAGGQIVRVSAPIASPSGNGLLWDADLGVTSGASAGETRVFQAWYRDVSGPCTTGSNVTNGIRVTFLP